MSIKELFTKMHSGEIYDPMDEELMSYQETLIEKVNQYNQTPATPEGLAQRESMLKELFASVGEGSYIEPPFHANFGGLHVHIGAATMSDLHYCRLVRNYQRLENVIDTFMAHSRRGNNSRWCHTLQGIDFSNCRTKRDILEAMNGDRYFKVNAASYSRHRTIEFRQHQGSTDYEKISNWVRFLAKLVEYSYKHEITTCTRIEDVPFLTDEEKQYFIRRRVTLN